MVTIQSRKIRTRLNLDGGHVTNEWEDAAICDGWIVPEGRDTRRIVIAASPHCTNICETVHQRGDVSSVKLLRRAAHHPIFFSFFVQSPKLPVAALVSPG